MSCWSAPTWRCTQAKQQGRDQVVIFTTDEARALARRAASVSWSQQIRNALEHDGLVLHWQPIVDLASGEIVHGELLLRMRRGER